MYLCEITDYPSHTLLMTKRKKWKENEEGFVFDRKGSRWFLQSFTQYPSQTSVLLP